MSLFDRPEPFRPQRDLDALRVPPQSVEAEQAVLGGLMLAPDRLDIALDRLKDGGRADALCIARWSELTEQVGRAA